jgi:hypothetical protein
MQTTEKRNHDQGELREVNQSKCQVKANKHDKKKMESTDAYQSCYRYIWCAMHHHSNSRYDSSGSRSDSTAECKGLHWYGRAFIDVTCLYDWNMGCDVGL